MTCRKSSIWRTPSIKMNISAKLLTLTLVWYVTLDLPFFKTIQNVGTIYHPHQRLVSFFNKKKFSAPSLNIAQIGYARVGLADMVTSPGIWRHLSTAFYTKTWHVWLQTSYSTVVKTYKQIPKNQTILILCSKQFCDCFPDEIVSKSQCHIPGFSGPRKLMSNTHSPT
jgi:hypothetical protein